MIHISVLETEESNCNTYVIILNIHNIIHVLIINSYLPQFLCNLLIYCNSE